MSKVLRVILGLVFGYTTMVVLITLVQEGWFGGVGWYASSAGVLTVAGLFTCLAAAVGGVVATALAHPTHFLAATMMSCLVVVETTLLISTGRVAGPLWFDLLAALSLILSILLGAWGCMIFLQRRRRLFPDAG